MIFYSIGYFLYFILGQKYLIVNVEWNTICIVRLFLEQQNNKKNKKESQLPWEIVLMSHQWRDNHSFWSFWSASQSYNENFVVKIKKRSIFLLSVEFLQ